ncbi:rifin PIR protein,putative [Plasmodium sp. DRC-Itaito]|nr:rifin PIR protein,putative [Plasmodium sp. DRC-Itaito]SPJ12395.1 rifin PIR protein,putative [Plasmodium sp. DRC-Itaito]
MKVHYINILLFAHALNILVSSPQKNPSITQKIPTTRSLFECELYSPAKYDDDPQMKEVMQQFQDRTSQRFHEYDDRMVEKRKACKDKCDKEIQKIILKDKLEKELMDKFATLDTDIQNDAIPTCVCEKSIADKVEKGCLRCGGVLGGGVAPGVGILGGIGEAVMSSWKVASLEAATKYAIKEGIAKGLAEGNAHGMYIFTLGLEKLKVDMSKSVIFKSFVKTRPYIGDYNLESIVNAQYENLKWLKSRLGIGEEIKRKALKELVGKARQSATAKAVEVRNATTATIQTEQTDLINTIYVTWETTIIASVIAIVVIVLIMVIIYLILRRRRKKKMKKKLQYIKLLEE